MVLIDVKKWGARDKGENFRSYDLFHLFEFIQIEVIRFSVLSEEKKKRKHFYPLHREIQEPEIISDTFLFDILFECLLPMTVFISLGKISYLYVRPYRQKSNIFVIVITIINYRLFFL